MDFDFNTDSIHGEYDNLFDDRSTYSDAYASIKFDTIKNNNFERVGSITRVSFGDANAALIKEDEEEKKRMQQQEIDQMADSGEEIMYSPVPGFSNSLNNDITPEMGSLTETLETAESPLYQQPDLNNSEYISQEASTMENEESSHKEGNRIDYSVIRTRRASLRQEDSSLPSRSVIPSQPFLSQSPRNLTSIPSAINVSQNQLESPISPSSPDDSIKPKWTSSEQNRTLKSNEVVRYNESNQISFSTQEMSQALYNNSMINSYLPKKPISIASLQHGTIDADRPSQDEQTEMNDDNYSPYEADYMRNEGSHEVTDDEAEMRLEESTKFLESNLHFEMDDQNLNEPSEQYESTLEESYQPSKPDVAIEGGHSGIYDENGEIPLSQLQGIQTFQPQEAPYSSMLSEQMTQPTVAEDSSLEHDYEYYREEGDSAADDASVNLPSVYRPEEYQWNHSYQTTQSTNDQMNAQEEHVLDKLPSSRIIPHDNPIQLIQPINTVETIEPIQSMNQTHQENLANSDESISPKMASTAAHLERMMKSRQEGLMIRDEKYRPSVEPVPISKDQEKVNAIRERIKANAIPETSRVESTITTKSGPSVGMASFPVPPVQLPGSVVSRIAKEERIYTETDLYIEKARAVHKAIEEYVIEIEILKQTNEKIEKENLNKDSKIHELEKKVEQYDSVQKDVSALVAKTREDVTIAINNEWSKKITGEIKKSEEKVQSMEDQLNRKKKEIETLHNQVTLLQNQHQEELQRIKQYETDLQSLEEQFAMEQTTVQHVQSELKEERRQNKNREEQRQIEIEQLRKNYEEECQRNNELREKLHEQERQAVLSKYRKDDSEEMRRLKQEHENDIREKMRMETEMEGLKSDVTVLNGKLRDADSRNKQCEAELIDYKMKVERMEAQIKQLKESNDSNKAIIVELSDYVDQLLNTK